MALTTKDEAPVSRQVVTAKSVTEDDIKALYNEGKNLYDIARIVFGFDSEEAIERIRRVLGVMEPPETQLMDE